MLEHRFDKHDRSQLELKLTYGVNPEQKKQKYQLEAFIFIPRVLAATKHSYGKRLFYQDTSTFIRRKTPNIALSALAKESGIGPWTEPFTKELEMILSDQGGEVSEAIARLKVLACILKSALRDELDDLTGRLESTIGQECTVDTAKHAGRWLNAFTEQIEGALKLIRQAGVQCETAKTPSELRDAWRGVDEFISLIAEETLTETLSVLDGYVPPDSNEQLTESRAQLSRAQLAELAVNEYRHRRSRGFQTYVHDDERNEYLSHRRHVLKRFVSSILYLDVRHQESGRFVNSAIGMVAAAFAMLFATFAALFAQFQVGASVSGAFISVMVLSYIVKDRIKDEGKRALGKRFRGLIADHVTNIEDEDTESVLGQCRENFTVADSGAVDSVVRELRHADHPTTDAVEGRPETVLCYTKDVSLMTEQILSHRFSVDGLNDIIRFNVQRLTKRMDDPWETYDYVDPDSRKVESVKCARVYHLNIVLRLTPENGEPVLERTRVIVNRKGIQRVQPVMITSPALASSRSISNTSFAET